MHNQKLVFAAFTGFTDRRAFLADQPLKKSVFNGCMNESGQGKNVSNNVRQIKIRSTSSSDT